MPTNFTKPHSGDPGYTGAVKASTTVGNIQDAVDGHGLNVITYGGADNTGVATATTAIQNTIDAFGGSSSSLGGGHLVIPAGTYKIDDTILFNFKRLRVKAHGARFIWAGAAGKPMVQIKNSHQMLIDGLRLHNPTANNPTAAISFNEVTGFNNSYNRLHNIAIGPEESEGTTVAFDNGIIFEGDAVNDDSNWIDGFRIRYCTTGINVQNTQNVDNRILNGHMVGCGTAFLIRAHTLVENIEMASSSTTDFDVSGCLLTAHQITSESSAQFLKLRSTGQVMFRGGYWQVTNSITAGGDFINAVDSVSGQLLTVENFNITQAGGYSGPTPIISMKAAPAGSADKTLRLIHVRGASGGSFSESTLDVAPVTNSDTRVVEGSVYSGGTVRSFRNVLNRSGQTPSFQVFDPGPAVGLRAYGNSGSALTLTTDAPMQTVTNSASCTYTMPSGLVATNFGWEFDLIVTNNGAFTATFTGVKWNAATAPTLTSGAGKVDVFRFRSPNGGTTWYGEVVSQNTA